MVRHPRRPCTLDETFEAAQMLPVGPVCRPEVHRNSVLHHTILLQDLIKDAQRSAAANHEILGDNFEPVHDRLSRQDVVVVGGAKPNSYTVVGEVVESIRGHVRLRPLQREKIEHFNLPLPQENVVRSRSGRRGLIVTHFLSIGPATTLALARVLALAAIVAGFATALALARVLTLTGVLFLYLLIGLLVVALALILRAGRSLQRREQV